MTTEIVLSDGFFASVRNITVADMCIATKLPPGIATMAGLCSLCVKLDGREFSIDEWMILDYAYVLPVFEQLRKQLESAYSMKDGVA